MSTNLEMPYIPYFPGLNPKENWEQEQIFIWSKNNIHIEPRLKLLNASLNGVDINVKYAQTLKKRGMNSGIPDINLPIPNSKYHGLYIELKRLEKGTVSKNQKFWIEELNKLGYLAVVCKGHAAAIKKIIDYLSID